MSYRYTSRFTAKPEHIDANGHVNNTVWLQWVQDIAIEHWNAAAAAGDVARFLWVVTRHEVDYRGNVAEGDEVSAETWIEGQARGATSIRRVDFRDGTGKLLVSVTTTWAMLDRESGRLARIRPDVLAPFARKDGPQRD